VLLAFLLVVAGAAPAEADFTQHIADQKKRFGDAAKDLWAVIEPPFVVWGDAGPRQVQNSATNVVRWTVRHLEADFFPKPPDGIYDIYLFQNAESYERHAFAMWHVHPDTPFGYATASQHALVMNFGTGGGTLVHEMVHPYMAANFPNVPTWLNEGLASLYEQSDERDGKMVGLTNWRLAGLNEAIKAGRIGPFSQFVRFTDAQFRDDDEAAHYGQARYLMLFLQERGLLQKFVKRALELQAEDPTAGRALQETLGADWKGLDARWRKWVATLRFPEQ
jgi:hypothetical protein